MTQNFITVFMFYLMAGATAVYSEITIPKLEDLLKDGQLYKVISRGELIVGVKADDLPGPV